VQLRAFEPDDLDAVVALSLRAWQPFFDSFPDLVGFDLATALHPDFHGEQTQVVTDGCTHPDHHTSVATVHGVVAGFAVVVLDHAASVGQLHLIAVDPAYQRLGIAGMLNDWALGIMQSGGMRMARVGTGGDDSHAPARRSYERAGYTPIPVVHYFKLLPP
jgi:GNAT superfamily N-acetyltransferase